MKKILGGQSLAFKMILVVNICKEKLHYLEFVKPVEDILKREKLGFFSKGYREINPKDLARADKIIICGTSLRDNDFMENLDRFSWVKEFDKSLLGICGGFEVIGKIFKGIIKKEPQIGFFHEKFHKNFLGLEGSKEVYHLHNYYIDFSQLDDFDFYCVSDNEIVQAVKHLGKPIYATLFHPEVRQKDMIVNFCKL